MAFTERPESFSRFPLWNPDVHQRAARNTQPVLFKAFAQAACSRKGESDPRVSSPCDSQSESVIALFVLRHQSHVATPLPNQLPEINFPQARFWTTSSTVDNGWERYRPSSFAIWVGKRGFGSFGPHSDYPPTGLLPQNTSIGIFRP
jgi:hypothetical protein